MTALPQVIVSYRQRIAVGLLLVVAVAAVGLSGLGLNANYTAYFDHDDPLVRAYKQVQERFAGHDSVVLVIDLEPHDALDTTSLDFLHRLASAIERLPHVLEVRSVLDLATASAADAQAEAELVGLLGAEPTAVDPIPDVAVVRDDPRATGLFVSRSGHALLIEIAYALPAGGAEPVLHALNRLRAVVDEEISRASLDATVHYSGALALNEAYIRTVHHDLAAFGPALAVGMLTTLVFLFRNVRAAASMFGVALLAAVAAFGAAGWLQLELAAIDAFAPVIIMSLSIAGSVHLVSRYAMHRQSAGPLPSLHHSLRDNLAPLSLSCATTAAGFAALLLSPSPPVRVMGVLVAIGVVSAWALNLGLLPLLLGAVRGPIHAPRLGVSRIAAFASLHATTLRRAFLLIGGVSLVLATENRINDNVFEYFADDHEFRRDTAFIKSEFSGANRLTFVLDTQRPYGLFDEGALHAVAEFQGWLLAQNEVVNALTVTAIPRVQQALEGNGPGLDIMRYREIARDHSPQALGLSQLIDEQFAATAVHVYLDEVDAQALLAFDQRARTWLATHASYFATAGGVGPSLLFAHLGQRNARSMIEALAAATLVLSLICGFITGTLRGGCTGLFVNLFPIAFVFGLWALSGGYVSIGGTVVIGMVLGIVVDDTLYLLMHYRRARETHQTFPMTHALVAVGPALIVTTTTLCVGFATGLLSDFAPIATMSLLSIAIIAGALATDLLALNGFLGETAPNPETNANELITVDS